MISSSAVKSYSEIEHLEKSILSAVIHEPSLRKHFKVKPPYFSDKRHGEIAERIISNQLLNKADLFQRSISGTDPGIGGYEFVRDVLEYQNSSNKDFEFNQKMLLEKYKERETNKALDEFNKSENKNALTTLSNVLNDIKALQLDNTTQKSAVLNEIIDELYDDTNTKVFNTDFKELDKLIDGIEPQQLNILAGRPSMGKTAFALQLALNLSRLGSEVIYCSAETSQKNITQRMLSNLSGVPLRKFKKPSKYMSLEEINKVLEGINLYQGLDITVDDNHIFTPETIRSIARNTDKDKNVIIMIDYLQLMKSDTKKTNRYEEVSDISRELKMIAGEFKNITIIGIAQLSRAVDARQDKRPLMSDLKESGQIEQDAHMIMFLYRDDYYQNPDDRDDEKAYSELNLSVAKNKDGPQGMVTLQFYTETQRIM